MPLLETFANASARGFETFGPTAAAGAYELISTAYGTGSSSTITFDTSSLNHKHLQIRYTARNTSTGVDMTMRFNGVTTSTYATHRMVGTGSIVNPENYFTQTSIRIDEMAVSGDASNIHSAGICDILDFGSSTKNTTVRTLSGKQAGSTRVFLSSGLWNSTAAVTSISLISPTAFTTTSRFSLYGIKG